MLALGTKVKVIRDDEDPESGWVGATGKVFDHRDGFVIVKIEEGNPNPDDGAFAWFGESELEILKS